MVDNLRNGANAQPTGLVGVDFYSPPWVVGQASDPVVTLTDGTNSIQVHVPAGTPTENETGADALGGADATQPYLVWSCNGALIDGSEGNVVQAGSTISCTYILIADGSGPIMMDAVTGLSWQSSDNALGHIQDLELSNAVADPSYVIPHTLQVSIDFSQTASSGPADWPGLSYVTGTGLIPSGAFFGIPADVPMPEGQSRGFNLLWTSAQQFGWYNYNENGGGALQLSIYTADPANAALATDISNSIDAIMGYLCILQNQTDLSSMKGMVNGVRSDAFPAPPLLDYSPTGGVQVEPSSFGAWFGTTQGLFYDTIWEP